MKKDLLDRIDVKTPCTESWEEITGNAKVRFCSHCSKDVYDLSAITRSKAEKLVRDSNGRLCVRYIKDTRGKIITARPQLTQIKRQATIAAGVLAASLSLSISGYSQGKPSISKSNNTSTKDSKRQPSQAKEALSLSGLVVDEMGAVIPGATIVLQSKRGGLEGRTNTNENGTFTFAKLEPGKYAVEITSAGFRKLVIDDVELNADIEFPKPLVLEVGGEVMMGVVVVADRPLMEPKRSMAGTEIELRPLEAIPATKVKKKKNNLPK